MIIESGVKHVGVFWLKDPASRDKALSLVGRLAELPQVQGVIAGTPIDHDWPAVKIDKSWDVGFVISFRTMDDCRSYFGEPLHQDLAGQLRDLSERVFAIYIDY